MVGGGAETGVVDYDRRDEGGETHAGSVLLLSDRTTVR